MRKLLLLILLLPLATKAQQQPFPGGGGVGTIVGLNGSILYNNKGTIRPTPGFVFNTNTGALSAPGPFSVTSVGVASNWQMSFGPLPLIQSGSDGWTAPPMGNTNGVLRILPGTAGGGIFQGFPGNGYVQYGSSGDANHATGRITGITSSQPVTVLCTFSFCQQGSFFIVVSASDALSCSNASGSSFQVQVTFTDDVPTGPKTITIPLTVNGGTSLSSTMGLGTGTNSAFGWAKIYNASASNISYQVIVAPCTTGVATVNYNLEAIETL
jgi:hypothetical protein